MKIKIKLKSIKENERAGATSSVAHDKTETRITVRGTLPKYLASAKLHLVTKELSHGQKAISTYLLEVPLAVTCFKKIQKDSSIQVNMSRNIEHYDHAPIPKYSYKYKNPIIKCPNGHKTKLKKIEYSDPYNDLICPKCYCDLDIEYESIDQALKRKRAK